MAAPLDGVVEQLAEGIANFFEDVGRYIGLEPGEKALDAIDDGAFAGDEEFDPMFVGGEDFDGGLGRIVRQGVFDGGQEGVGVERLAQELINAATHGIHQGGRSFLGHHDDDFRNVGFALQAAEETKAGHFGHPDIEENEVDLFAANEAERGDAISGSAYGIAFFLKNATDHLTSGRIVIGDEDIGHE